MGNSSSRHEQRGTARPHPSPGSSTRRNSSSTCTTQPPATVTARTPPSKEFTDLFSSTSNRQNRLLPADREGAATTARLEQSGNYFSNEYKRQLSQRKAAMRYEKEQRNSRLYQHRSQESSSSAHLSREDLYRLTESRTEAPTEANYIDPDRVLLTPRSTAPSVISETSVRTVAHKPATRRDAAQRGAQQKSRPPGVAGRRAERGQDADTTRYYSERERAGTGPLPLFFFDTSNTTHSWFGGQDDAGGTGYDGGFGGDNTCSF